MVRRGSSDADQQQRVDALSVLIALTGAVPKKAAATITDLSRSELAQVAAFKDRLDQLHQELTSVLDGARERIEQDALQCW